MAKKSQPFDAQAILESQRLGKRAMHASAPVPWLPVTAAHVALPAVDKRQGPDRRGRPRGGRRPMDRAGHTPLVLVADQDPRGRDACEAILARLHFAVAPCDSVERALAIMDSLQPDVIVAQRTDVLRLRQAIWRDGRVADVSLVVVTERMRESAALVEAVRRVLRAKRAS
jgi:CheY-like chemotaxis protein